MADTENPDLSDLPEDPQNPENGVEKQLELFPIHLEELDMPSSVRAMPMKFGEFCSNYRLPDQPHTDPETPGYLVEMESAYHGQKVDLAWVSKEEFEHNYEVAPVTLH